MTPPIRVDVFTMWDWAQRHAARLEADQKRRGYTSESAVPDRVFLGVITELAVGRHFGWKYDSTVGVADRYDFAAPGMGHVDVKAQWESPGRSYALIVNADSFRDRPMDWFIFCTANRERKTVTIWGGAERKDIENTPITTGSVWGTTHEIYPANLKKLPWQKRAHG